MTHLFRPISARSHSRAMILRLLALHTKPGAVIYDIGCGDKPFEPDVTALGCAYIGVDIAEGFYQDKPDLIGTATCVPVESGVADIVISSQVLEHIENPFEALNEAHRLLKPGGILLCSFPFFYPIHAAPHDYGRYTRFYIARTAQRLGYLILSEHALAGYWQLRGLIFSLYAQSFDRGPVKYIKIIPFIIAIQQWFCVGMHYFEKFILKLAGKNPDNFYLNWPINYVFALEKSLASKEKIGNS